VKDAGHQAKKKQGRIDLAFQYRDSFVLSVLRASLSRVTGERADRKAAAPMRLHN
jgi:hypothetical protein